MDTAQTLPGVHIKATGKFAQRRGIEGTTDEVKLDAF